MSGVDLRTLKAGQRVRALIEGVVQEEWSGCEGAWPLITWEPTGPNTVVELLPDPLPTEPVADRDALAEKIARAVYAEGAYCGQCGYEGWDRCRQCRDDTLGYARAMLALPQIADALDLADRFAGAEAVQAGQPVGDRGLLGRADHVREEWGARHDAGLRVAVGDVYVRGTEAEARDSVAAIAALTGCAATLVRRTVTTLRTEWEAAP